MDSFTLGILAGIPAAVAVGAVVKLRRRHRPMSVAERAEDLSKRRARTLPALALIFLSQQAIYLSNGPGGSAQTAKIAAWLVLSVLLVAALATKGFWLEPREVRDLIDDENTRANRNEAMRWGFLVSMGAAVGVYFLTIFDNVTGRGSVHIIMSAGIAAALLRWAFLERRAQRDA